MRRPCNPWAKVLTVGGPTNILSSRDASFARVIVLIGLLQESGASRFFAICRSTHFIEHLCRTRLAPSLLDESLRV